VQKILSLPSLSQLTFLCLLFKSFHFLKVDVMFAPPHQRAIFIKKKKKNLNGGL
jgi:hypothetical protein